MKKLYDGELEENVALIASYTVDETNRVGCNVFCDIEPPETGASRAEWAYRCRVPSNETHDMNKYELVAR